MNTNTELTNKFEPYYRGDKGSWELTCEHGMGHEMGIHGCDGCCSSPEFKRQYELIRNMKPKRKSIADIYMEVKEEVSIINNLQNQSDTLTQSEKELVEKFREKFLKPYSVMSYGQFKTEYQGTLASEFEQFLIQLVRKTREEEKNKNS